MDIYIDDYIGQLQTSVSVAYESQQVTPSGRNLHKCVDPIDTVNHVRTFVVDDKGLSLTVSVPQISITPEIDSALWKALDSSTSLVSKGSLLT